MAQPEKSHSSDPNDGKGCFLGETRIRRRDGSTPPMRDLKTGHVVQVVKKDGRLANSPIIGMLHWAPDEKATFKQIYVEGKTRPISLTPDHLIYASKTPKGSLGPTIFAKNVEEGMYVFLAGEDSGKVAPAKVQEVREVEATGYCAPLTKQGTVMADGVAASCYADFDHELSHRAFWLLRLLYGLKSALGVGGKRKNVTKVGIHRYARALMKANKWLFHVEPATATCM
ncbi:desert hedgehog protein-like isoform X2 [Branchiostoma floridae x Branchiostoma japonicum]